MIGKRELITWILVISMAFGVWYLRADTLCEVTKARDQAFTVEATLITQEANETEDGGKTYEHEIVDFTAEAGSEEAEALLAAMDEIACRSRWKMPFERVEVYSTGKESIELNFKMEDGRIVDLSLLSGARTIYDLGSRSRQYSVNASTFEILAACIEQYGTVQAE